MIEKKTDVRLTDRISIGLLSRVFTADLIDEVVGACGRQERRSRLLPARVVVYYTLALALFFGESYDEVMRRLVGGLRFLHGWSAKWKFPSSSAISQARARLGAKPLEELFHRAARPIGSPGSPGVWFGRWRVMAIDGVVLDAPDTQENEAEFGRLRGGGGTAAFPQVRVVGLAECGTHAMVGAAIDSCRTGERPLADQLLDAIEPGMLVLADRNFHSLRLWKSLQERSADILFRVSSRLVLPAVDTLPDGSYLSVLLEPRSQSPIRKSARRTAHGDRAAELAFLREHGILCRVIEYRVDKPGNDETVRLITSILGHEEAPANELAALYHERWEFEMTLDEIEIHQMGHGRVLRSKSPELVRQEIWGMLLTHYAIRHFMHEAAQTEDVDEDRLSFIRALRIIRHQVMNQMVFPPQ